MQSLPSLLPVSSFQKPKASPIRLNPDPGGKTGKELPPGYSASSDFSTSSISMPLAPNFQHPQPSKKTPHYSSLPVYENPFVIENILTRCKTYIIPGDFHRIEVTADVIGTGNETLVYKVIIEQADGNRLQAAVSECQYPPSSLTSHPHLFGNPFAIKRGAHDFLLVTKRGVTFSDAFLHLTGDSSISSKDKILFALTYMLPVIQAARLIEESGKCHQDLNGDNMIISGFKTAHPIDMSALPTIGQTKYKKTLGYFPPGSMLKKANPLFDTYAIAKTLTTLFCQDVSNVPSLESALSFLTQKPLKIPPLAVFHEHINSCLESEKAKDSVGVERSVQRVETVVFGRFPFLIQPEPPLSVKYSTTGTEPDDVSNRTVVPEQPAKRQRITYDRSQTPPPLSPVHYGPGQEMTVSATEKTPGGSDVFTLSNGARLKRSDHVLGIGNEATVWRGSYSVPGSENTSVSVAIKPVSTRPNIVQTDREAFGHIGILKIDEDNFLSLTKEGLALDKVVNYLRILSETSEVKLHFLLYYVEKVVDRLILIERSGHTHQDVNPKNAMLFLNQGQLDATVIDLEELPRQGDRGYKYTPEFASPNRGHSPASSQGDVLSIAKTILKGFSIFSGSFYAFPGLTELLSDCTASNREDRPTLGGLNDRLQTILTHQDAARIERIKDDISLRLLLTKTSDFTH